MGLGIAGNSIDSGKHDDVDEVDETGLAQRRQCSTEYIDSCRNSLQIHSIDFKFSALFGSSLYTLRFFFHRSIFRTLNIEGCKVMGTIETGRQSLSLSLSFCFFPSPLIPRFNWILWVQYTNSCFSRGEIKHTQHHFYRDSRSSEFNWRA